MSAEATSIRLIGAVGVIGFLVPALGTAFLAPTWFFPATDSSAAVFAAHLADHATALRVGVLLDVVGVTLWGAFGVGVWTVLRRATGGQGPLWACFLFGVVALSTMLMAGFTVFLVLTYRTSEVQDPRLIYDLTFGFLAMSGLPTAVALASYATLTLRVGFKPRSTAIVAAIAAVAHLLLLASFFAKSGFFAMEGQIISAAPATLFAWILVTGIALLRGHPRIAEE